MFRRLLSNSVNDLASIPKEGELYKIINVHGHTFELYYGYYDERERKNPAVEPMPIYPDFQLQPQYTSDGYAFVTKMQDICKHYEGEPPRNGDCAECVYYAHGEELLGICTCKHTRRPPPHLEKRIE